MNYAVKAIAHEIKIRRGAYFYSAAERRSRGALWPSFAPALILFLLLPRSTFLDRPLVTHIHLPTGTTGNKTQDRFLVQRTQIEFRTCSTAFLEVHQTHLFLPSLPAEIMMMDARKACGVRSQH
jgi:hypothetical protein